MTTLEWIVPEDSDFWPCPMGCGGGTDDEGGGPCRNCWNALDDEDNVREVMC